MVDEKKERKVIFVEPFRNFNENRKSCACITDSVFLSK